MLIGFIGTFLPVVPGTALIFAGAGVFWLMLRDNAGIAWVGFGVLFLLLLVSMAIEALSSAVGAKWFGASRWGALGALAGGVIGIFFGIIGLVLGPVIGAVILEVIVAKKQIKPAGKSGLGTVVGGAAGVAAKLLVATLMIAWFLLDVLVWDQF